MTKLEEEAVKYAKSTCDQAENISLDNLRDYAKTDFIAGAEWNKSISKAPEMLKMLEYLIEDDQLSSESMIKEVKKLIKKARTL